MNYKHTLVFLTALVFITVFSSCKKDSNQDEIDHNLIVAYAAENQLDGEFTSSGLYYVISEPGSANHPTTNSQVTVSYRGYKLNGTTFDSGEYVRFYLYQVIKGWQEGISLIGENGKIKLIIPSDLAYGSSSAGSIGPNEVLVFDVELHFFLN